MDETDQRLIAALRRDGRATLSDLASALGLSRATIRARMERLSQSGEITGFTVLTRSGGSAAPVRGMMMIGIEGRGTDRILTRLTGISAIQAVHTTNGRWDLIAEIGTATLEDFDAILAQIRRFEGVTSSETNLLLTTRKSGR